MDLCRSAGVTVAIQTYRSRGCNIDSQPNDAKLQPETSSENQATMFHNPFSGAHNQQAFVARRSNL